jgi:hypothetical protein
LSDKKIGLVQRTGPAAEQPERAEYDTGGAHRHGVHRGEAGFESGLREPRPSVAFGAEVFYRDGLAGGVAVDARALVGLQLEQFEFTGLLGGGGQQP